MFNRHLSLNIFRLDETAASYFSVRILYSSIMSSLRRRYAKVGNFSFRKGSLYSMSLKPGINLVALH